MEHNKSSPRLVLEPSVPDAGSGILEVYLQQHLVEPSFFSPLAFAEPANHASVKIRPSATDAFWEANPEYICKAGWDPFLRHHMDSELKRLLLKGGSVLGAAVPPISLHSKDLISPGAVSPGRPRFLSLDSRCLWEAPSVNTCRVGKREPWGEKSRLKEWNFGH